MHLRLCPRILVGLIAIVSVSFAACGGSSSSTPTTPSTNTSSSSGTCRTYATNQSQLTIAGGVSITRTQTCQFSTASNQLACTLTISTCGVVPFSVQYGSTADFVNEVSVIPPKTLAQSQTTASNACGITNGTYTYDGQQRLMQYTINGVTNTYTAWDSSGRPSAGTVGGLSETYSYNDAARTATLVINSAQPTTTVYTYDASGNLLTALVNGGSSTTTNTVLATAQVCK